MLNPGFLYLFAAIPIFFFKEGARRLFSIFLSILVLISVFTLSEGMVITLPFLDFELILLEVDNISRLVGVIFAFAALVNNLYSLKLAPRSYYLLAYLYIGSSISILFVGDLFSFYIFWEMMTISSYFLIFNRNKEFTAKTSYYYFIMHLVGGVSLLWGIFMQYSGSGSIILENIEFGIPFFILGVGIKAAFIGLHTWLPQNYINVPFYITLLLSIYTTKVGVYGIYKFLGGISYLSYFGAFSALIAAFFALRTTNVRKIFSYHLISQIGYMIIGITSTNYLGSQGGIFHLFNGVLYKSILFMTIGIVIYSTKKEDLVELGGLAKQLPFTAFCCIIGAFGIMGLPFFNGYLSKVVIKSALESHLLVWVLYITGIATSLSLIKVIYFCFFGDREVEMEKTPTLYMKGAMFLFVFPIIVIGLWPRAIELIYGLELGVDYYSLAYIWEGLQPTLWALLIFKLAHDIIEPKDYEEKSLDFYSLFGRVFNNAGRLLTATHNGNLSRYFLWIFSTLILLWINLLL
ncbi:proton-conducting transporter membrane subunit [Halonatronum saccharophilum]|uniref:proton-conducting transporter transmembrane domain-containing protein n=1 Tax=Halonatronum saccharophilum TaxID=150060 RepID=UPI000480A4E7|nr:proton-conducting transporter membrane subunit [Halonatronum saccharophilum]